MTLRRTSARRPCTTSTAAIAGVLLLLCSRLQGVAAVASCPKFPGYAVAAGVDHSDHSIQCSTMKATSAEALCSEDPSCVAFNTFLRNGTMGACTKTVASPTRTYTGPLTDICFYTKASKTSGCPKAAGYTVAAAVDHAGDDIQCSPMKLSTAVALCSDDPSCVAFNTFALDGARRACTKHVASPTSKSSVTVICFYTKIKKAPDCPPVPGYTVAAAVDHVGDDIQCSPMKLSTAVVLCSDDPSCIAFNTFALNGARRACTKQVASPISKSSATDMCFYTKQDTPPGNETRTSRWFCFNGDSFNNLTNDSSLAVKYPLNSFQVHSGWVLNGIVSLYGANHLPGPLHGSGPSRAGQEWSVFDMSFQASDPVVAVAASCADASSLWGRSVANLQLRTASGQELIVGNVPPVYPDPELPWENVPAGFVLGGLMVKTSTIANYAAYVSFVFVHKDVLA